MSEHNGALTIEALPTERYAVTHVIASRPHLFVAYARELSTDRAVLVKAREDIDESKKRLAREADILGSLSHPQIPQLLAAELEGSVPYIVTEAKPGNRHVGEWLKKYPAARLAAKLSLSALHPLSHVHEQGFAHRDVKLSNLVMQFSGAAALVDFELGVHHNDHTPDLQEVAWYAVGDDDRTTQIGRVMGTPAYMSPERVHGLRGGLESDIYSMGIVMYELLFGKPPFEAEDPTEIARMHCYQTIDLSDTRGREVPDELLAVIERATQKEPSHRYPSAEAMSEDIAGYLYQFGAMTV